jgi:integrative and conjugative element protein (TIGR02256 family)
MPDLRFISEDRRFEIKIDASRVSEMVRHCIKSGKNETGGILVGKYNSTTTCAHILVVKDAPTDSVRGPFTFVRGVRGLQRWLDQLWRNKQGYYLGEWHFHPFAAPNPSSTDVKQMEALAQDGGHHCPEPILLILGGDPQVSWSIRVFVFPRGRRWNELHAADDNDMRPT